MPLSEQVVDAVTATNFKVMAEGNTALFLESQKQYHAHNNRMSVIAENLLQAWGKSLHEPDPVESVSAQKLLSGNDMGQFISAILAALSSGQQGAKIAQTTPPPTA